MTSNNHKVGHQIDKNKKINKNIGFTTVVFLIVHTVYLFHLM